MWVHLLTNMLITFHLMAKASSSAHRSSKEANSCSFILEVYVLTFCAGVR
jgi:hypothetical protein